MERSITTTKVIGDIIVQVAQIANTDLFLCGKSGDTIRIGVLGTGGLFTSVNGTNVKHFSFEEFKAFLEAPNDKR